MKYLKSRWLIFTATCWLFTPLVISYARLIRDAPGFGGEILFPLLPVAVWLVCNAIGEAFKKPNKTSRPAVRREAA